MWLCVSVCNRYDRTGWAPPKREQGLVLHRLRVLHPTKSAMLAGKLQAVRARKAWAHVHGSVSEWPKVSPWNGDGRLTAAQEFESLPIRQILFLLPTPLAQLDQSSALRRRGLHVRVVHGVPSITAFSLASRTGRQR